MRSQIASPSYTPVFAALVSIVNCKLPDVGALLVTRVVMQFKRSLRRRDRAICVPASIFLAHLINQQVRPWAWHPAAYPQAPRLNRPFRHLEGQRVILPSSLAFVIVPTAICMKSIIHTPGQPGQAIFAMRIRVPCLPSGVGRGSGKPSNMQAFAVRMAISPELPTTLQKHLPLICTAGCGRDFGVRSLGPADQRDL